MLGMEPSKPHSAFYGCFLKVLPVEVLGGDCKAGREGRGLFLHGRAFVLRLFVFLSVVLFCFASSINSSEHHFLTWWQ